MKPEPRVALFTDSFLEVNGVAHTSRQLAACARRLGHDLLLVHAGPRTEQIEEGSVTRLALARSSFGFRLDADLRFDLKLGRHARLTLDAVRAFGAEAIHITGPSDIGLLGVYVARKLQLPLVISWHTNVHEYAGRRLSQWLRWLPQGAATALAGAAEQASLRIIQQFYRLGRVLLAPNEELAQMLERACGRPVLLMRRGVDADLFSPVRRDRRDGVFTLGYVGRLTPEKNVRLLVEIERELLAAQARGEASAFRFLIVGQGGEGEWLADNLQHAEFAGVLKGEALARAYANLDLFVFPSETDTFGNVVLEAQSAAVPAAVSAHGGPKFIIADGRTGFVAATAADFARAAVRLMCDPDLHQAMREAARARACAASWESIFALVQQSYRACLALATKRTEALDARPSRAELRGTPAANTSNAIR